MFLPGFCLSTSTYLLGFLHTGDNEIVEVLEGFDTRKILSGYVETEVLFYQYHHIDQVQAVQFKSFHSRCIPLDNVDVYFKLFCQSGSYFLDDFFVCHISVFFSKLWIDFAYD